MIYLGVSAAERTTMDAHMTFFSPDTDVMVLIIANYDRLPKSTDISLASHVQKIEPLWVALGPDRVKALLGFHAFSGADNTGRFSRIGKSTWFKHSMNAEEHIIEAFHNICHDQKLSANSQSRLEEFVCTAYSPKGIHISRIPELRWYLFCKYMTESDRLPPTV
ncbi:hypothetical protein SNE40_021485 [Patella caerulea]|uniref:Uncharacterized protein n=1 Tax=Patella caerulea TaxID=87958 RepID=A0AAN8J0K9_PATCE